jgi:hypothetical protein
VLRVKRGEPSRSDQESASPWTPMEAIQQTIGDAQAVFCICRLAHLHSYIHRAVCLSNTFNPHTVQLSRESSKPRQQLSSSQALTQRSPLSPPPRASTMQGSCMEMYLYTATCNPITSQRETRRRLSLAGCERKRVTCSAGYVLSLFVPTKPDWPFHVAHEPVCQHTYLYYH